MIKWIINNPASFVSILTGLITSGYVGVKKFLTNVRRKERERINAVANQRFVYDVATNHLPHVFDALKLIANKLEVELPDPPPIRFVEPFQLAADDK